jgi:SAM-dependent methyltransferase
MQTWLEYWHQPHRLYVNERHLQAHYRRLAADVLRLLPQPAIEFLDWGCGPALGAPRLADAGVRVTLYDRSPAAQAELRARFADDRRIRVLDDAAYAALPEQAFEVIVVNSVCQYLTQTELEALLLELRHHIRPGGRLVLGDIPPPEPGAGADALALLRAGLTHGFFLAALGGLLATVFSDYRRLRARLGLSAYTPEKILALFEKAGFRPRQLHGNIGFAAHRNAFEGQVPPG